MKEGQKKMEKESFEEYVKQAMEEVIKSHQHNHPLYQETRIEKSLIDPEKKIAAFVLFEQIDTDRCTEYGDGWLGDQYRYSVWYIKRNEKPKQLYEDHAYLRRSVSGLTGTRGRDPRIGLEKVLEDGVIATITPKDATDAYGDLSQLKVKITLEGKIDEPEVFIEQAKNLVKRIGDKLGYDYMSGAKELERKNIAAIVWEAENGSTYGFDTVYLVWKNKEGRIDYKEITNSRSTKDYLSINEIKEDKKNIVIKIRDSEYKINKKDLE